MEYFVLSLDRGDRKHIFEENRKFVPELKLFKSVNGYDKQETILELKKLGVEYHDLDFPYYGTLACWITKVKMLQHQIKYGIPYICFIEDDLLINEYWRSFVTERARLININVNIVRLCPWGEAYITSIESAKRLMKIIKKEGVKANIDNQLRSMGEKYVELMPPAQLCVDTNFGDCTKTDELPSDFKELLKKVDGICAWMLLA